MSRSVSHVLIAGGLFAAACTAGGAENETAQAITAVTVDSAEVGLAEAGLLVTALDGAPLAASTAGEVASYIAGRMPALYTPPACVIATTFGPVVTVVFDDCAGPFGLVHVDGELRIVVSPSRDGSVTIVATADGLAVGAAVLDVDATAVYRESAGASSVDVTTRTVATGGRGNLLHHAGDYTATWDATCAAVDGAWASTFGGLGGATTASIGRCGAGCPSGVVTRETIDHRTISIAFDGTATAIWTSSTGAGGEIALACTP